MSQAIADPLAVLDAVHDAMATAIEQSADDIAADLRRRISVPVIRSKGRVIRSRPGEPPRKDSGDLLASVQVLTVITSAVMPVEAAIWSDSPYAAYLEEGTEFMSPRPVWDVTAADWADRVAERVAFSLR